MRKVRGLGRRGKRLDPETVPFFRDKNPESEPAGNAWESHGRRPHGAPRSMGRTRRTGVIWRCRCACCTNRDSEKRMDGDAGAPK